ncbi:MAG: hypothetical protein M1818_008306 [Claussenomyces sp. TS43310]|nr:MAG: hypothetical protein M1818_008306 [Claussenomyces sp. TS43310]
MVHASTVIGVATTFLSFIASSTATYDAAGKTNVALYYGQGSGQARLRHFCDQTENDIIPLAFLNRFLAQGNGYPGSNFGDQCAATVYNAPGYHGVDDDAHNYLLSSCAYLPADIAYCQSLGKKVLLSLGGATPANGIPTYALANAQEGTDLANFVWGAYGPYTATWAAKGLPRPFDYTDSNGIVQHVVVDGFDLDIESSSSSDGYVSFITTLRALFGTTGYLITGAPQCVVPDANMGDVIQRAKFDIIWVQFYNTASCSARNWVDHNPNFDDTHVESSSGFTYNAWASYLEGGASKDAKLYIGLMGGNTPLAGNPSDYLDPAAEVTPLLEAYHCHPSFGGVMIWEATYADENEVNSIPFQMQIKNILSSIDENICPGSTVSSSTTKTGSATSTALSCTAAPVTTCATSAITIRPI